MTLVLRYAALSDIGRGPKQGNEDSGFASPRVLAVADGMGGMVAGDVASALTIDTLRRLDPATATDPYETLTDVAREANARIAERITSDPRLEGMGTTFTAGILTGDQLALAHIGDSRAYLLHDDRLDQITHDHTFVQSLIDDGRLTPEEAAHHPHRALITRALQGNQDVAPDLATIELAAGDRLLFCSDGLDNAGLDDDTIAELLRQGADPEDAARLLIERALDQGAPDNVTCVIGEVVDESDDAIAAAPTAPAVVGAASEFDEPGASEVTATQVGAGDTDFEPADEEDEEDEELRYAPRPPGRFRWLRRTAVTVLALGVVGVGLWAAYTWSQAQYYVGAHATGANPTASQAGPGTGDGEDGTVERLAIYRGVAQRLPGVSLSDTVEVRDLDVRMLPTYHRQLVEATISAEDLADARAIVAELERVAARCRPQNQEQPEPTDEATATDDPTDEPTDEPTGDADPEQEPGANDPGSQNVDGEAGIVPDEDDVNAAGPEATADASDTDQQAAGVDEIPLNCDGIEPDSTETR